MATQNNTKELTQKQFELLDFLKMHIRENGQAPRLKEIAQHFNVTNKAILDMLNALEKKGRVSMPGEVQELSLRNEKDIFISYSSKDKKRAGEIKSALETVGYSVWIDDTDIVIGENIVTKVFDAILECNFFIVLLSQNSILSTWVQEELSTARISEIKQNRVAILPIKIDEVDDSQLPSSIKNKKYLNISKDFKLGMRQLVESLVRLSFATSAQYDFNKDYKINPEIFRTEAIENLNKHAWPTDIAYKQFEIFPQNLDRVYIPKSKIEDFIDEHRVKLAGYGGFGFPYETRSEKITSSIMKNSFYMEWAREGDGFLRDLPEYDFWQMFEEGYLVSRNSLQEDSISNEFKKNKILSLEWLEMDIARPLMLAKKFLELFDTNCVEVHLMLVGMYDRKLHILNNRRSGFSWDYQAKQNKIEISAKIDSSTDLLETAFEMTLNIVEQFNWKNINHEVIRADMKQMLDGKFPN